MDAALISVLVMLGVSTIVMTALRRVSHTCAPEEIIAFWFRESRGKWFVRNAAFDNEIRDRFGDTIRAALSGSLRAWEQQPRSSLALVLVLDQFTRNVYRDSALAFSGDADALRIARRTDVSTLTPHEQWFMAMPFEHSEKLKDQITSIKRFKALSAHGEDLIDADVWAHKHFVVIKRFGRFPHRNAVLDRTSTPAELAFLEQPDSSF